MTWKQIKDYINTLSEQELNDYQAMAYHPLSNKYYLIGKPVTDKTITEEPCLNVIEL